MESAEYFPADEQPRSIADTHELPSEQFIKWWTLIDAEDRDEFQYLHLGDEILARFVCALDYLHIAKVQGGDETSLIQLAYHIACKPYPAHRVALGTADLRARATRAYAHDAVQNLLTRVRHRRYLIDTIKLRNELTAEAMQLLRDASQRDTDGNPMHSFKQRKDAASVAMDLLKIAAADEAVMRAERSRRGIENARRAMTNPENDSDNPRVMEATIKAISAKLGKDKVLAIMGGTEAPAHED